MTDLVKILLDIGLTPGTVLLAIMLWVLWNRLVEVENKLISLVNLSKQQLEQDNKSAK